jgi:hypothetical protein
MVVRERGTTQSARRKREALDRVISGAKRESDNKDGTRTKRASATAGEHETVAARRDVESPSSSTARCLIRSGRRSRAEQSPLIREEGRRRKSYEDKSHTQEEKLALLRRRLVGWTATLCQTGSRLQNATVPLENSGYWSVCRLGSPPGLLRWWLQLERWS